MRENILEMPIFERQVKKNHSEKMIFQQNINAVNGYKCSESGGKACHAEGLTGQWLWGRHMSAESKNVSRSVVSDPLWHPMDCSLPGSSVHGILQARILEWVAISFSKGFSWPRGLNPGLLHFRKFVYSLSHHLSNCEEDGRAGREWGAWVTVGNYFKGVAGHKL